MTDSQNADLSKLQINRDAPPAEPSRRKSPRIVWLGAAVVLAAAAFFIFRGMVSSAPEVEATSVILTTPSQANAVLNASGYVVAQRKAAIASKGTGRLVRLTVQEGDRVKKGMVIGQLEDSDVLAALAQAKANLAVSQADLVDAKRTLDRTKKLFDASLASQADLDAAQAQYDRVTASIAAGRAAVDGAEVALENTRVRAPFDGTVLTKDADVGEVISPFASSSNTRGDIVTMADMNSLEVEADVSESNIEKIYPGQPCEITLDAFPGKRYRGEVNKIVPTVDRAKATVKTKVIFLNRDESVLPEMSAKVAFLPKTVSAAAADEVPKLAVSPGAIVTRDGRKEVLRIRDGVVTEVPVTAGASIGTLIEIRGDVSAGDRVVLKPADDLRTGSHVTLKSAQ